MVVGTQNCAPRLFLSWPKAECLKQRGATGTPAPLRLLCVLVRHGDCVVRVWDKIVRSVLRVRAVSSHPHLQLQFPERDTPFPAAAIAGSPLGRRGGGRGCCSHPRPERLARARLSWAWGLRQVVMAAQRAPALHTRASERVLLPKQDPEAAAIGGHRRSHDPPGPERAPGERGPWASHRARFPPTPTPTPRHPAAPPRGRARGHRGWGWGRGRGGGRDRRCPRPGGGRRGQRGARLAGGRPPRPRLRLRLGLGLAMAVAAAAP
jgi:hypothetical protein